MKINLLVHYWAEVTDCNVTFVMLAIGEAPWRLLWLRWNRDNQGMSLHHHLDFVSLKLLTASGRCYDIHCLTCHVFVLTLLVLSFDSIAHALIRYDFAFGNFWYICPMAVCCLLLSFLALSLFFIIVAIYMANKDEYIIQSGRPIGCSAVRIYFDAIHCRSFNLFVSDCRVLLHFYAYWLHCSCTTVLFCREISTKLSL